MIFQFCQVAAAALHAAALVSVYYKNYRKRSVYGLSFDLMSFTALEALAAVSVFCLGSLKISSNGYNQRYPVSQPTPVPLSVAVFALSVASLAVCCAVLVNQVHSRYRHTTNQEQNMSYLALILISAVVCVAELFSLWISDNPRAKTGRYGFLWVDLLEFLCFTQHLCSTVRLLPQVSLNFSTFQAAGLSRSTILFELLSSCLILLSILLFKPPQPGYSYEEMYLVSLNYQDSIVATATQIACCLALLCQRRMYTHRKIVPLKHKELTTSLGPLGLGPLESDPSDQQDGIPLRDIIHE